MSKNLSENTNFRLNEDSQLSNDGKIYVFVKLTDSCMKTIESSLNFNKKTNQPVKSKIKFNHHYGEIFIPISQTEEKKYSFQIIPENKTPEVFECIRQSNRSQLESCSMIEQRLNIQAQDDVYDMTKSKVTELQKLDDQNKKQTKEIGESSKTILEKRTIKSNIQRNSSTGRQQLRNSKTVPTSNNIGSMFDRPLRELVIHFLAARQYRRPDLLVQLKLGGKKEEEKKEQLDSILSSISTCTRLGEYSLNKNIYLSGEVDADWPFYTKQDSIRVKDKINEFQSTIKQRSAAESKPNETTKMFPVRPQSMGSSNSKLNPLPTQITRTNEVRSRSTTSSTNEILSSCPNNDESNVDSNQIEFCSNLSEMLEKLNNAIDQTQIKSNKFEKNSIDEENLDLIEKEYQRLLPEYNKLYDYLQTISEKFNQYKNDFQREPNNEKATKIVKEFFKCEENDRIIDKRKRLSELHSTLKHYKDLIETNQMRFSSSNRIQFEQFDDEQNSNDEQDQQ